MSRTYEFSVSFIGHGDTLEEAWEEAVEQSDLSDVNARDAVNEEGVAEFVCPVCEINCLPDANNTPDEDRENWNCQGCGSSWNLTEDETLQTYADNVKLDEPIEWDFKEDDGDES